MDPLPTTENSFGMVGGCLPMAGFDYTPEDGEESCLFQAASLCNVLLQAHDAGPLLPDLLAELFLLRLHHACPHQSLAGFFSSDSLGWMNIFSQSLPDMCHIMGCGTCDNWRLD